MMTKKHFQRAAEMVSMQPKIAERRKMATAFVVFFKSFKSNFDEDKFRRACNI